MHSKDPRLVQVREFRCLECGAFAVATKRLRKTYQGHVKDMWCYRCQKETKHIQTDGRVPDLEVSIVEETSSTANGKKTEITETADTAVDYAAEGGNTDNVEIGFSCSAKESAASASPGEG